MSRYKNDLEMRMSQNAPQMKMKEVTMVAFIAKTNIWRRSEVIGR